MFPKPGILDQGRSESYISVVTLLTPCLHAGCIEGSMGDIVILQPEVSKHLISLEYALKYLIFSVQQLEKNVSICSTFSHRSYLAKRCHQNTNISRMSLPVAGLPTPPVGHPSPVEPGLNLAATIPRHQDHRVDWARDRGNSKQLKPDKTKQRSQE